MRGAASGVSLVDTHCHLTHPRFEGDLEEVLVRASRAGVERVVTIASTADDAGKVARLVADQGDDGPALYGTAGVHPHQAAEARPGDLDRIRALLEEAPGMVAVGETGLDFHYDHSPRDRQRRLFLAHLEMARELDLPAVVHSRSAEAETRDILLDLPPGVRGVLHCFAGDEDLLEAALEAGWLVSFTGIVTFSGFDGAELVRRVPEDRFMVETDGPYLAPVPYRGKRNEPARVLEICRRVAELRGEDETEVARRTTATALRFFGLPA